MDLDFYDIQKLNRSRIVNPEILKQVRIKDIKIDSRKCKENDLFFGIKGERFDGHEFIPDIIKNGTKAFVVEKMWFSKYKGKTKNVAFIIVENVLNTLGELASIYRKKFLLPVIAVGGSNGKTTAKDFIAYVLSKQFKVLKTEGNFNNAIGVPLTLFRLRKYHEICVIEIGTNHFGEIEKLCRIVQPQFGVLTNIGKEHLEFLNDVKGVIQEEFDLVRYLRENFGTFFLNKDDRYLTRNFMKNIKVLSFGNNGKSDVKGKFRGFDGFSPNIEIKYLNKRLNTTLRMIGRQSFDSALCAAAIGFFFEVPVNVIKRAISEYHIESKKRNELKNLKGFWVIDDSYNSNPDSVRIALENMKQYKVKGNKHIVLGDMLELGKSSKKEHFDIGKYAKILGFENLYTFGKESYSTFTGAKGIRNNFYFTEKETLSQFLKMTLRKKDLVLVKGSRSMKMEEVVESIK